jgi:hypothetical protein
MTGQYPEWWTGKKYNEPIRVWIVGESVTLVRDTLQKQLCGAQEFGTGTIALLSFCKKPIMVSGGLQAIDTFFVTHETDGETDGTSVASFKTFEQRRERLQSETVDLIWVDEKPANQRLGWCAGTEFLRAAKLLLQRVADQGHALADDPNADRLVVFFPGPPFGVLAGHVPGHFCGAGQSLADLVATIKQSLMHARAAGGEEFQLCAIPKCRVQEVDTAKLAPAFR